MKKNILAENMRRFATKNLYEQDNDQNNNGYPDDIEQPNTSTGTDGNFIQEVNHAKALLQNRLDIVNNAEISRNRLIKVLSSMENDGGTYANFFNFDSMGFRILDLVSGAHGFLYLNTSKSVTPRDLTRGFNYLDSINRNPSFQEFFTEIAISGNRNNYEIQVQIKK